MGYIKGIYSSTIFNNEDKMMGQIWKINNENLQPNEVALKILETFNLEPEFKEKDENANKIYV